MGNFEVELPDFDDIRKKNKIVRKEEFEKIKGQFENLVSIHNKRVEKYETDFQEKISKYNSSECEKSAKAQVIQAISNIQDFRKEIKNGIDYGINMLDKYKDKIPPNIKKIPAVPPLIKKSFSKAKASAQKVKSSDELNNIKELKYKGIDLGFMTKKTLVNTEKRLETYFSKSKEEFEKFENCTTVSKMKNLVKSICNLMELEKPEKEVDEEKVKIQKNYMKYSHKGFIYNYYKVISSADKAKELDINMQRAIGASVAKGERHGNNFVGEIWNLANKAKAENIGTAKKLYQECYELSPMDLWKKRKEVSELGKKLYNDWSKIGKDVLNRSYVIEASVVEDIMNKFQIVDSQENFDTLMLVVAGSSAGKISPEISSWINYGENTLNEIFGQSVPEQKPLDEN